MFGTRSDSFALFFAVLLGACAAPAVRAEVVVVPNALATIDGNIFNDAPMSPLRYMQIHDGSQFAALPGPIFITQFAWRPDTVPGPSGPYTHNVQIFASTTNRPVAGLSSTFAQNIGPDNTRGALERQHIASHFYHDLWRALRFVAIYDGYVAESMNVERFMDVLGLLEFEVFNRRPAWGPRKARVQLDEPIDLKDHFSSYNSDKRGTVKRVTTMLESSVRQMLDELEVECQPLHP